MDDLTLMRVIHVLAVTLWIGGVAFVTLIVMPMIQASEAPEDRHELFQKIEARFAWQAKIWVLLAGASGLWMTARDDMWYRFTDHHYWWMHLMVAVWAIFSLMLFVIEPLYLRRRVTQSVTRQIDFRWMVRMHQVLLALSLTAIFGAVGGSHGLF